MKFLTKQDLIIILESLSYSKKTYQEYDRYQDEKFRKQQLVRIEEVIAKVNNEINEWLE